MINKDKILNNKKLMNILNFMFFAVLIIFITMIAYVYMDYITPKLEIKEEKLLFQKKTDDNIAIIDSPIQMVLKKKKIPITVKKGEEIIIKSLKKFALEPDIGTDNYILVPMYINMQEEEIKIERFEYVPKTENHGYYFKYKAPQKEGLYTYNINLKYRNTIYLFTMHIQVI